MDRRGTTIGWIGIVCLMALATGGTWTERKGVFYSENERIMDRMLRTMDESVSPCEDFHKYSSGRYSERFNLKLEYFADALGEEINPKFHSLFEKLKNRAYEKDSMEEKVVRLYNSCEAARRENRSSNIFLDVMRPDINLSWPLYMPEGRKWPQERFRWLTTMARLSRHGLRNVLFHVSLRVDSEDKRSYVYVIDRADMRDRDTDKFRVLGIPIESINNLEWEIDNIMSSTKSVTKRLSLQELERVHGISLMDYFKVAHNRNLNPNTLIQADVAYLEALNRMLNSYDQETVANYLMGLFGTFMTSYQDNPKYQCVVAVRTSMKAACEQLYNKHILGETHELESQVQLVFEAIRKQFSQRLEANRLNLSTTYITNLRNKLDTTTLNIGILPKKKNRQRSDNYLYKKLDFDIADDFATMQLKAMDLLENSEDLFLDKYDKVFPFMIHPGYSIEFGVGRTIFIPYDLLVEPFFSTQSHDVFKVSLLGYIIADQLLKALYPTYSTFDCQRYKEFIDLLDDKQMYWDRSTCLSRSGVDWPNLWGLHLVLMNIVHDAYFSPGSGFSQVQPEFSSKPLKQLFFLNIVQNLISTGMYWWPAYSAPTPKFYNRKSIYNPVFKLPTYAEAFNCSTTAYPAVNYSSDEDEYLDV